MTPIRKRLQYVDMFELIFIADFLTLKNYRITETWIIFGNTKTVSHE